MNTENLPWFEPFCGMLGVTRHIEGPKTVSDNNKDLILMWKEVFSDTLQFPNEVSRELFNDYRASNDNSGIKGFVLASSCFSGNYGIYYGLDYKGGDKKLLRAKTGVLNVRKAITYLTIIEGGSYDRFLPVNMCVYC